MDTCLPVLRQHEPGRAVGYGPLLSTGSAANESHLHGETMYYSIQYSSVILPMPLSPKEYARLPVEELSTAKDVMIERRIDSLCI
jgi:hypothetical protein